MNLFDSLSVQEISEKAHLLFNEERQRNRLDGWFLTQEIKRKYEQEHPDRSGFRKSAEMILEIARNIPLTISDHAIFAGTQRDSFARSYALINPEFKVETFSGYCDPTAVYNDIEPDSKFSIERITEQKNDHRQGEYARALAKVYADVESYTSEVVFFVEQVTGHLIPDFRYAISHGITVLMQQLADKSDREHNQEKKENLESMRIALQSVVVLAERYAALAGEKRKNTSGRYRQQWAYLEKTLLKIPAGGAKTLFEAIQSYLLLWQTMCLEQSPNPYAFSVGNADRIFEPYRAEEGMDRNRTAQLLKHFLVFFNVGDRSWAISQNILAGGKSSTGIDLTNETTFALLDAYHEMNLPQPILSVKLHQHTPDDLYRAMGRFFFEPGCLTPSLFNDDSLFKILESSGIDPADLEDYAVAGCQEPLIMGKDNGNTTNSWLNLAKILELTLNDGRSMITGKPIGSSVKSQDNKVEFLKNIRESFYQNVDFYISKMVKAANAASKALALCPVPFLSAFMGGMDSGYDLRDTVHQGTQYNGSGCLIHGLAVIADSFIAIDTLLSERPQDAQRLLDALRNDFDGYEDLREFLLTCPKYGNNSSEVDSEAVRIAKTISDKVHAHKNDLGNPFRPDWSTPSTHLLYGYWVGATPDGRKAREMMNYGIDPLYGDANSGLGFRMLSCKKLPFQKFVGGYASHFGIDPKYFNAVSKEEKGLQFRDRVIAPLFFDGIGENAPFYIYVNVTTADILRKVLQNPKEYAPSGVYIMRIHGTFVNFLDLSPAIQEDIIKRLDPKSTAIE